MCRFRIAVLCLTLAMLQVPLSVAQKPAVAPAAPIPPQILAAKKVFIANAGGDEMAPETHGAMARIAEVIKGLSTGVRLEGHTDSIPINTPRFQSMAMA